MMRQLIVVKRMLLLVCIPFLAFVITSCGNNVNLNTPENVSPTHTSIPSESANSSDPAENYSPTPSPEIDSIQQRIDQMSLDEKIGQLVIVGLDGLTMNDETLQMIQKYKVGGFILFKNNINDAEQTLTLLNRLKEANKNNPAPLWLSVDQEGGRVSRLSSNFIETPAAGKIGAKDDLDYTHKIGQAIGEELHALGFNMNFAPVLDINSNPKNPVIGDRSFGSSAETVIEHGLEMMRGLNSKNIASVVKHFPGHGDTSVDSHYDLPIVNKSLEELQQFELLPFEEAIQQNVDAIMIAHLLMLQIDDKHPASISASVIDGLLRQQLGYDGVVITDDMTMGGLLKNNQIGEAAVQTILAGTDIVLVSHQNNLQLEVIHALKAAVENQTISEQRLDESLYRLLRLKQKYDLQDAPIPAIDVPAINESITKALESRS